MFPVQAAVTTLFWAVYLILGVVVVSCVGYLLTLMISATRRRKPVGNASVGNEEKFTIVIPAHNEEMVIGATLNSLKALDYRADRFHIVVIADNCTDATISIVRAMSVQVMERNNLEQRGKGYALEWAFRSLLADTGEFSSDADAFVIVDADTIVAPDFLREISRRLWKNVAPAQRREYQAALQGRYGVLNTSDSWRSALMTAAFDLVNHVKPLGRDYLGFSVGLKGNGMAFTRALLLNSPWQGSSITEDIDYGLDLLQNRGIAVGYAPKAIVTAQMPVTAKQSESQRERWERGRYKLMRQRAIPLLGEGIRRGNFRLIDAALDLLIPPLAELFALCAAWLVLGLIGWFLGLNPVMTVVPPIIAFIAYICYVLGGLKVAGARPEAYSALLRAPGYALWKFALLFAPGRRKAQTAGADAEEWVRTERTAMPTQPTSTSSPSTPPSSSEGTP
ncbi:MAG: glycosyltransferase family 2 protein [bacterium]|jgi:glycosyltransferase involved in cell wall biosynthesis